MLNIKILTTLAVLILFVSLIGVQSAIAQDESEIPTPISFVSDYADIFGETQEEDLNKVLADVLVSSGLQIYVLVVESMGDLSIEEYGNAVMESWGIDEDDGLNKQLLFIVAMDQGEYNLITSEGLERYVPDEELARINNEVIVGAIEEERGIAVAIVLGIEEIIGSYKTNLDESTTVHRASGATGMRLTDFLGIAMILGLVGILLLINSISF